MWSERIMISLWTFDCKRDREREEREKKKKGRKREFSVWKRRFFLSFSWNSFSFLPFSPFDFPLHLPLPLSCFCFEVREREGVCAQDFNVVPALSFSRPLFLFFLICLLLVEGVIICSSPNLGYFCFYWRVEKKGGKGERERERGDLFIFYFFLPFFDCGFWFSWLFDWRSG